MLGTLSQTQGQGIEFADEVSRLIWSGTENWHKGGQLADAIRRCKLNLGSMDEQIQSDPLGLEEAIQLNQTALRTA